MLRLRTLYTGGAGSARRSLLRPQSLKPSAAVGNAMARKRRGRRRGGFVAIPFAAALTLGTLTSNVAIPVSLLAGAALTEDLYIMSIDGYWSLDGQTALEGPFVFGYNHGDLDAGEIGEALDASPRGPGDIIAIERARRPVRRAGQFSVKDALPEIPADGEAIRTKCRFTVESGKAIEMFVMNRGSATLTTGSVVDCNGTIYGRWRV